MSAPDMGGVMFEHFRKRNERKKKTTTKKQLTAHGQEASQRAVCFILLPVTNAIHLSTAFSPSQTYFTCYKLDQYKHCLCVITDKTLYNIRLLRLVLYSFLFH